MNPHLDKFLTQDRENLLAHVCQPIPRERLHLPGPDFVDRVWAPSDRSIRVLGSLQRILGHGRLGGTGYLSILPVDQGVEHSAGASFAANPEYFDPENIVRLAIEGGCNAVASTVGVLGSVARRYAHRIPFIVKLNHNELLSYPNVHDQIYFGTVRQAWEMGAAAVGATIYFGSPESHHQLIETSLAAFKTQEADHHTAADLTGQANHLGVTIQADIIKQKLPTHNQGYEAFKHYGKSDSRMYTELASAHPIDLTRYQVINGYAGRSGLINSGGASGPDDFQEAVRTAIINKRAGGMGLISGRKAFQRPFAEGIELLHAIQDVYLEESLTVA